MKPSFNHYPLALTLLFAVWVASVRGQEVINADLIVNGNVEIHEDNLKLGLAQAWDGTSLQPAFGLTINYAEMEPTANYNDPGHSTIMMQAAQELATFKWQGLNPSTGATDLMQLTNDGLMVSGTQNTLPNQTLNGGAGSILTKQLADSLYLSSSGGSITGNITISGSMTVGTLAASFTGEGTDNRLTNQVANHANSIMTKGLADARYLQSEGGGTFRFGFNTVAATHSTVVLGDHSQANAFAVSIGAHAGNMGWMASGEYSISLGFAARSPGVRAVALGAETWASGDESFSALQGSAARATHSIALGKGIESTRIGQVAMGKFNSHQTYSLGIDPLDHVFVIGNGNGIPGDPLERSNALVVKRNGNMEVKGTSLTVNGAEVLTEASASSLFVTQSSASTTYLTVAAASTQYQTKPEGEVEFLTSDDLVAIQLSIDAKIDEAELEAALEGLEPGTGGGNYLSKDPAIGLAYGTGSSATASTSVALGDHVVATRQGEVVVGRHNKETPAGSVSPSDPVFIVGAGSGDSGQPAEKRNALVVRRDGNIHVEGVLRVKPAGNLSMGDYEEGPEPGAAD